MTKFDDEILLHLLSTGGKGGGTQTTVDDVVTQSSENTVKSSGIYTFVKDLTDPIDTDLVTLQQDVEDVQKGNAERDKKIQENSEALSGKQDKLTFDNEPTASSNNPVTSQGIATYVEKKISEIPGTNVPVATDTVTGTVKTSSTFDSTFTEPVAIDSDGKLHVKKQAGGGAVNYMKFARGYTYSQSVVGDEIVIDGMINPMRRGTLTAEINSNTYELNPLPEFGDVDVPMNGIRLECTIDGEPGSWKGEVSCSGSITNIRGQYTRTCWLGIPVLYNVSKESYILLRGTGITIQSKTQPTKDLYESDEVDGQATADWTLTVKQ